MHPSALSRARAAASVRPDGRRSIALLAAILAAVLAATLASAPPSQAGDRDRGERGHHDRGNSRPAYLDARLPVERRVADLLSRMTIEEKVGQMAQAERADVTADPGMIADIALGSVLSGGGSTPTPNTPEAWADMVDSFQEVALSTRLGIPLLYGVDAVHGHANMLGATVFPHNIGLGATRDARLVEKVNHVTAIETRASGPQWNFAPCLCVARDDRWGRTYESFGESPRLVSKLGGAAIDGLQGHRGDLDERDRVLATAKHFAGDGLTTYGTGSGDYTIDQGIAEVSREEFAELALAPYWPAVRRHDVGSVMPSFSSVDWTEDGLGNPLKMHAHEELLTDVLKGAMDFDGFVISDWQGIRQIPGSYDVQVETAVNAGVDMFMEPYSGSAVGARELVATLLDLVATGRVSEDRIDDAVRRILTAKFRLGLFERPFTDRRLIDTVGSRAHRALAREAVAKSQVLLTNRGRTLPLRRDDRPVYVAGSNADNIGNQAGGWTLTWQGGPANVIPGNTVLDGIEAATDAPVTFSADASAPVPAGAAGVVVVGETPYAEGFGDVGAPGWPWEPGEGGVPRPSQTMQLSAADRAAVETVCAQAASCTVLVVSGRPVVVPPDLLGQVDALVASWLPGSEGRGVADVLFGRRPFTGRLPVSWPRTVEQEPINVGDERTERGYDPLFGYGHGLTTRVRHRGH